LIFKKLGIEGAFRIEPEPFADTRGVFRRSFCEKEFKKHGLTSNVSQSNISENHHKFTLRGFHYQTDPHSEAKTMMCLSGSVYDIIVDLRPKSPSYLKWESIELTQKNRWALHIPKGCANSFLTLSNNTVMVYYSSNQYEPKFEKGIRYNDPLFDFKWPIKNPKHISEKDANWPNFTIE